MITPGTARLPIENGEVAVPAHLIEEALDLDAPPPEPKNDDERAKIAPTILVVLDLKEEKC